MMLDALPTKSRIRKDEIQLVPMPPPTMPDALAQGLVDAIFAIPPGDSVAESKYNARTIVNATELVPYVGLTTVAIRRDFAESNPEATGRLLRAYIRLSRWAGGNETEARKDDGREPRFAGRPGDASANSAVLPQRPAGHAQRVEPLRDAGAEQDDRAHPDPAKLFDAAIVEPTKRFTLPAAEALGLQPDPDIDAMLKGDYRVPAEACTELLRRLGTPTAQDVAGGLQ